MKNNLSGLKKITFFILGDSENTGSGAKILLRNIE